MEPKIAKLLRSWNGNIVKVDRRAGLSTECEGEIRTLGPIHLHTPSPATCLDCGKVFLEGSGSSVRVRISDEDQWL